MAWRPYAQLTAPIQKANPSVITVISLWAAAFLAATILPFSSEVLLASALAAGQVPAWVLISAATVGNVMGACVNWWLGQRIATYRDRRWFPVSAKSLESARNRFARIGVWSLLLSWVPIIGDPITLAAGVLGVRFRVFLPLVFVGKAARYAIFGLFF